MKQHKIIHLVLNGNRPVCAFVDKAKCDEEAREVVRKMAAYGVTSVITKCCVTLVE